MSQNTLFDRIWDQHRVAELSPGIDLLHVDRHLLHDLGGGAALAEVARRGLQVRNPELTFATPDHLVASAASRTFEKPALAPWGDRLIQMLRDETHKAGIRNFDFDTAEQGIVHVVGPEQGLVLPGATVVCGDSHTCTHGAFGAMAWGIGSTELIHVLATQTVVQKRPKVMRAVFDGALSARVTAKDMILALIGQIGASAGTGFALEYAGPAVRALSMEARMTLCNLSIELGAKVGMIAPDDETFAWLKDKPHAPQGAQWQQAVAAWRELHSAADAQFDREVHLDCDALAPQMTWGTSPEQVGAIDERVPVLADAADAEQRQALTDALDYMGLISGQSLVGVAVDRVFIGSCTNSRLSDLRAAAQLVGKHRVTRGVRAWVVPGSMRVKQDAEDEGLDEVFKAAGFEWRAPGCSLCVGANGEFVEPEARCVSTSNRNFVGRQGPRARTHLASPISAAAAAIAGVIIDPRKI